MNRGSSPPGTVVALYLLILSFQVLTTSGNLAILWIFSLYFNRNYVIFQSSFFVLIFFCRDKRKLNRNNYSPNDFPTALRVRFFFSTTVKNFPSPFHFIFFTASEQFESSKLSPLNHYFWHVTLYVETVGFYLSKWKQFNATAFNVYLHFEHLTLEYSYVRII